jgi:multidrug efflux pump subunit AcrB
MSLIGMVILVGIVVNDSIVKVDFIVQARERGRSCGRRSWRPDSSAFGPS